MLTSVTMFAISVISRRHIGCSDERQTEHVFVGRQTTPINGASHKLTHANAIEL